jgi:hypothetical protein
MCIPPPSQKLKYLLGSPLHFSTRPLVAFAPIAREFLAAVSRRLISDDETRSMPDVLSFAWFCRRANLERLAANYATGKLRLGRGLALHITPTNMPVNFAFSWAFSVLAGNSNIVRVPDRDFPQIPFLIRHIDAVLALEAFRAIREMNALVSYARDEGITAALSAVADVRIIWGGDETIRAIRKAPLPARGIDIGFADRYSFCIMAANKIADLSRLATDFFNDAYTLDQNACSSPHLVIWLGEKAEAAEAAECFWNALEVEVKRRYQISGASCVDKFVQVCRDAIELSCLNEVKRSDNGLYRLKLQSLFEGIENRRCGSGYFYEYFARSLDEIAPIVTGKFQTLTYFGLSAPELSAFVARNRLTGIDRIVPVGKALDIGLVWDGFDLIESLSRICEVRDNAA